MKTVLIAFASLFSLFLLVRCAPAIAEGERCDPALSHNECAGDPTVQCTTPNNCLESYCCSPTSTSPNCQSCPAPDAGE